MTFLHFLRDGVREMLRGGRAYWTWLGILAALFAFGALNYIGQLRDGLVVTGMSDQVSWGFYIANFAFLVGIAAAAVLLVIPAYIFHRKDVKAVVLLGEGMAVAAVIMAMLFVLVDIGRPDRAWHVIPFIGRFNFPSSLLAWDIVVLNGYLALNLLIPTYVHYCHYRGREPNLTLYFPVVVVAMFWAISIHTVTAFLFSSNASRPFWNVALLGPRFIASAFASGPALIILTLQVIRRVTDYPVSQSVIDTLALIMAVAMQISLFFVGAELFTDFYSETNHATSMHYLFLGFEGFSGLRAVDLARRRPQLGGGDDPVDSPAAQAHAHPQHRMRLRVPRHLAGKGHGSRDPRLHSNAARRDLRVRADRDGVLHRHRHLVVRLSRLYAARQGEHRHRVGPGACKSRSGSGRNDRGTGYPRRRASGVSAGRVGPTGDPHEQGGGIGRRPAGSRRLCRLIAR